MLYKDSVISTYPNFYTHVAHYAFYVACILRGCDISTGFLYEYMDMDGYGVTTKWSPIQPAVWRRIGKDHRPSPAF